MPNQNIPDIVISRLPQYLRSLQRMESENRLITSSQELAERLGISAAQIRKDLSLFGEFGKQGTGYDIHFLIEKLRAILKVDRVWDIVVVGAGDIGSAIARYQGFTNRGFRVAMLFDRDPSKIGTKIGNFIVQDSQYLSESVQRAGIKIGMIAVPTSEAQGVANQLIKGGVRAILNYAPISINVPPNIHLQYIDPVIHLQRMTYYLD
ncbi:MAG: redox-sensing transcriptional repressor Rex [Anaerolineales bacterium]